MEGLLSSASTVFKDGIATAGGGGPFVAQKEGCRVERAEVEKSQVRIKESRLISDLLPLGTLCAVQSVMMTMSCKMEDVSKY